jgi:hypothetical protein
MTKLRLFKYVCLFVVVTAMFGSIDLAVQQDYRQSANDPQIQLAEDATVALDHGLTPQWNASNQIDAGTSLAPFIVIYNSTGTPVAASGLINGVMPTIPAGIFASVSAHGEDRVTWQTPTGLRFAAIIVSYKNGYVMAARSLREVEIREDKLNMQVGIPYLISFILVAVYCVCKWRETKKI